MQKICTIYYKYITVIYFTILTTKDRFIFSCVWYPFILFSVSMIIGAPIFRWNIVYDSVCQ